jgi:hypothetical protein
MLHWLPQPALSWFGADPGMRLIESNTPVIFDVIAQSGWPAVQLECLAHLRDLDCGSHT